MRQSKVQRHYLLTLQGGAIQSEPWLLQIGTDELMTFTFRRPIYEPTLACCKLQIPQQRINDILHRGVTRTVILGIVGRLAMKYGRPLIKFLFT